MTRIMLVDDDENVLSSLRRTLTSANYQIEIFNSPADALSRGQTTEFSLVISDYRMPGMDGVFFLTTLRRTQPDAIRIILSAYTDLGALLGAINGAEIFRFITKPWNDYDLKTVVTHALAHRTVLLENRRLADMVRAQQEEIYLQQQAIKDLETKYPGITRVNRGMDGSIILDDDG
ncbi:MAG TPA: response regulator [Gammaproteobacteria bacterium]|nr:response regulator [Gammaproteobacteria bacterium]